MMNIPSVKQILTPLLVAAVLAATPVHAQSGAGALYAKGLQAFEQGDMTMAERNYLIALRKNPIHQPSYIGLLDTYIAQQRYDDALETVDQALGHYPSNAKLLLYKAKLLNQTGEINAAKQYFNDAVNAAPTDLEVVRSAEDFLYQAGFEQEADAMADTRRALEGTDQ